MMDSTTTKALSAFRPAPSRLVALLAGGYVISGLKKIVSFSGGKKSRYLSRGLLLVLMILSLFAISTTGWGQNLRKATGGSGKYRNSIWWMNFSGVNLAAGQTFTRTFTVNGLSINVVIDQVSFTYSGSIIRGPLSDARLAGYQPGSYVGDGMDNLYNIGGTGTANTLTNALANTLLGTTPSFRFRAYATLNGAPIRLGLVFGSAEDDYITPENVYEFSEGTTNGTGWQLLEKYTPPTGLFKKVIFSGNDKTVQLQVGSTSDPGADGPGNVALMYTGLANTSASNRLSVNMRLRGGGKAAMAVGLIVDEDFGDAPASYGVANHVYFPLLDGGRNPSPSVTHATYLYGPQSPVIAAGTVASTKLWLGNTAPDADNNQQSNGSASGDDNDGNDDENAITPPTLTLCQNSYALTVNVRNWTGSTARLGGWIDFNRNGTFDNGEFASAAVANNATSVVLNWSNLAGKGIVGGQSYIRLRLSTQAIAATDDIGSLPDGEVEDHPITIYAPPVVTNPPDNRTICNGGNASFAATVTGANTYQWQQSTNGGSTWTNLTNGVTGGVTVAGAKTTTLTLSAVPTSWNNRRYRLVASNSANPASCRSVNSGGAILTVVADAVITWQPPSRTLCVGGTTSISSWVEGGTGTATTVWQRLIPGGSWTNITATLDGSRYTGFTTGTLTISNVNAGMNNYQYRRTTWYSGSGCNWAVSSPARLTVVPDPAITDHPDNLTICAPDDIVLTAQATGGIGALTYQWQQSVDNGATWTNLTNGTFSGAVFTGVFSPTMSIANYPAAWNGRRYRLAVGNAAGASLGCTNQVISNAAIITAQSGGPKITQQPVARAVCGGGTATFAVSVSGTTGTVAYQWQQSTDNGSTWSNLTNGTSGGVTIAGSFSNTLSLSNLTAAFSGRRYRVLVNDAAACNPVSAGALLTVNPDPVVTLEALNGTICAGSRDTLETSISGGAGTMGYQWALGASASGPFTTIPGASSSTLATDDNLPAGTYYYRVTVTPTGSGCSSATAVSSVTVNARPSVAVLSGGGVICPDGTASLQVAVTGGAAPYTVQYLEGNLLAMINEYISGSSIGVAPTATTAYSLVSVSDTNGCSSPAVSGSALVTVTGGVTSASLVGGGTVCAGSSSTVAVAIEGGVGPYEVVYSDGVTSYTATNYSPGSPLSVTIGSGDTSFELVSVTDAAGCVAPDEESIADFVVLDSQFATDALLSACDNGSGVAVFDLTQADTIILGGIAGHVAYYRDSLLTQLIAPASGFSSGADTVYARVTRSPQGCVDTARVVLELNTIAVGILGADSVCVSQPLQLSVVQDGGQGPVSYSWSGPNGFSSTAESPVVSLSATVGLSGDYVVTVTDSTGCMGRDTLRITVAPCCSLTALPSSSSVAACVGSTVSFSVTFGQGQGAPTVVWSGPNGFSASTAVVTIASATTADSGLYSYTVTDGVGCTAVGSIPVTIDDSINAHADPQVACVGQVITLNATAGGTSYQWSGPNGFATTVSVSSFELTSSATISMAGTYTVVVTGAGGCSGTATALVTVNPATSLTASVSTLTVCSGEEVLIAYTPTPAEAEVTWVRQPDGGIGTGNVIDVLTSMGASPTSYTYIAYISAVSGCQSNTVTTVVTVNPRPTVTPSSYEQVVCAGQNYGVTFTTDMPATVQWRLVSPTPPAPLSGTGDISATAPATPTSQTLVYQAWAVASGSSCSIGDTIETLVIVSPGLQVSAFASSATVCVGSPLSLSVDVVPTGSYTYAWIGPNGYVATAANPLVSATAAITNSGSYTVVVTDASGCSGTAVVPVVVGNCCPIPEPIATVSLCNNETLNLATYTPAGGSFTLLTGTSGSLSGSTFNGIVSGAGVFKVGFRPAGLAANCAPDTITVVVRNCTPPLCNYPVNAIVVDATCGNSDGRAELTVGGIPTNAIPSFAWSNGQAGPVISGLAAGIYSVTATITDGATVCNVIDTVQVNNIGGPIAELRLITPATCNSNGVASLSIVSGTGPFTVSWTGAASSSQTAVNLGPVNITNLPAGAYEFRISSAAAPGCFGVLSVIIPRNDASQITLMATATDATSCSSATGSIVITVQPQVGVAAPFSYSLNGQLLGASNLLTYAINNLPAGVYTVSASSASGCTTASLPVLINATGAPAITGWTAQSPNCPSDQGKLVFAGGQAGTTFRIREAITGAIVANSISGINSTSLVVSAGTYIVQTTSGTCVSADTLVLNRPQDIDFNVQYTPETCAEGGVGNGDGSLSVVQITGGTKPYTIVVMNDLGQTFSGAQLSALPAGNYSVNVTDANGCTGGEGTLVTVPPCGIVCPALDFNTVVVDTQCDVANGEATAQLLNAPSGATVTYLWSNGFIGTTTSGLSSGVYSVTAQITGGNIYNGCKYVDTVNVNAIGGPVFTVSPLSPASCTAANGSAVINLLSGTAPFTVSWTGQTTGSQTVPNLGSTTINGLAAGNYVFTVTGGNSTCQGVFDITLPGNSGNLTATATASDVTGCGASDGRITVNVSGGVGPFSYIVNGFVRGYTSTRTFSIQGLPAGTYYVEVTDRNGCTTVRENVLINTTGQPPIAGFTSTSPTCPAENGTIAFTGSGIASDQYVVTVAGAATQIGQTAGNVAASYSVPGGTYLITRTSSTSCVVVDTLVVNQPAGLDYNIQYGNPTCDAPSSGSLAVVQPSGGTAPLSYTVTGAMGVVTNLTALTSGSYTVTLGDANGCTLSKVVSLTGASSFTVTASAASSTVCIGTGTVTLNAMVSPTGSYTYTFTGPNGFAETNTTGTVSFAATAVTESGSYTVTVTDAFGCSSRAVVPVIVSVCCDLVASVTPVPVTDCAATTGDLVITYTGSQTYQYSLNGGAFQPLGASPFTVSNLAPGSYTVVVQAVGDPTCTTVLTSLVDVNPISVYATSNSPQCAGNDVAFQAIVHDEASGTFQWSGPNGFSGTGQSVSIPNATTLAAGTYTVVFTNAAGCSASATTEVVIASQPSLTLTAGSGQTICSGQSTTINVGGSNGATVTWSNTFGQTGTGTSIVVAGIENVSSVPQSITYVVNANAGTCSDQTTYVLTVNPAPVIQVVPSAAVYCDIEEVSITASVFPNTATINWNRTPATPSPPAASGSGTGTVTIQQTLPAATYTYTLSATGTNGCTSQPVNIPVTVQQ
ncbi:CshA/CshB family fibrillar adhesin-related protein [Larkinella bovis]|uniref:CshA/CshB family fibrillar adhesin-related protein n=1 Tax=Larkinella bovis TaxID=683041 RepID=A0ABW0IAK0_9BACT